MEIKRERENAEQRAINTNSLLYFSENLQIIPAILLILRRDVSQKMDVLSL